MILNFAEPAQLQRVENWFKKFDLDSTGTVSKKEFKVD